MSDAVKVVFMGVPEFAVPALRALHSRYQVVMVVTQPDRPQGRGQRLAPPPVKVVAAELGLPVMQPEKLRVAAVREQLASLGAELFVVAAYGKILSPKMLAVPRRGCINVHASLLPRYRGAAPIQWAVINREQRSGVTIMMMDEGMDTGAILLQRELALHPGETAGSLHDRLAPLGAAALLEALEGHLEGSLLPTPQPSEGVLLAPMLSKEDGRVDFARGAEVVDGWIRGLDPWPGVFVDLGGERLRLFASSPAPGHAGPAGEVLALDRRGLLVGCGRDAIWIAELQLAGRRRLPAATFCAGRPLPRGTRLGGA